MSLDVLDCSFCHRHFYSLAYCCFEHGPVCDDCLVNTDLLDPDMAGISNLPFCYGGDYLEAAFCPLCDQNLDQVDRSIRFIYVEDNNASFGPEEAEEKRKVHFTGLRQKLG